MSVSVTGAIVYFLQYQRFPHSQVPDVYQLNVILSAALGREGPMHFRHWRGIHRSFAAKNAAQDDNG
jgi:hypothetical protein